MVFVFTVVHLVIFSNAICLRATNLNLPYLVRDIGLDMVVFGYLQSLYNGVQIAGGLCAGLLFDRLGDDKKTAFYIAQMGTLAYYVMLSSADSLPLMAFSFLPSFCMHCNTLGYSFIPKYVRDTCGSSSSAIGALPSPGDDDDDR